ncbi:MAG TPA: peptidase S10 [Sphingobium sp.]
MNRTTGFALALVAATLPNGQASGQSKTLATGQTAPVRITTEHVARIDGKQLRYTASVDQTILNDTLGKPAASIFTFSYVAKNVKPDRPIIFIFNGGPGSSSIWTHMGALAPRRVDLPDPINPPTTAPFRMVDSPTSLLAFADLVFLDPVGTGYSRMLPGGRAEDFLGITQDARATADVVLGWLDTHGRWGSPKFMLGESYGTTRAILTSQALMGGVTAVGGQLRGASLNGLIILGPAFDINAFGVEGDDREFLNNLPTMAATAWVHGKLEQGLTLEKATMAAQAFARSDYLQGLYAGNSLSDADRHRLASRLAEISGIPEQAWIDANLRLTLRDFSGLLLKQEGKRVGAYDARFTLPARAEGPDPVADDPAMGQYTPAFSAALNSYVRDELGYKTDQPYIPIDWKNVFFRWDRGSGPGVIPPRNYATDLAISMRRNPALRVFVAAGYYDLVTTYGQADYALAHAAVPRDRVVLKGYASGHMPYLGDDTARSLSTDLKGFVEASNRH